jgi:hypothetical protein
MVRLAGSVAGKDTLAKQNDWEAWEPCIGNMPTRLQGSCSCSLTSLADQTTPLQLLIGTKRA